jgi:hypothetical protein
LPAAAASRAIAVPKRTCGSTDSVTGKGSATKARSVTGHWPQSSMMIARRGRVPRSATGAGGVSAAGAALGTAGGGAGVASAASGAAGAVAGVAGAVAVG